VPLLSPGDLGFSREDNEIGYQSNLQWNDLQVADGFIGTFEANSEKCRTDPCAFENLGLSSLS
jgi:hypothetical protein